MSEDEDAQFIRAVGEYAAFDQAVRLRLLIIAERHQRMAEALNERVDETCETVRILRLHPLLTVHNGGRS